MCVSFGKENESLIADRGGKRRQKRTGEMDGDCREDRDIYYQRDIKFVHPSNHRSVFLCSLVSVIFPLLYDDIFISNSVRFFLY